MQLREERNLETGEVYYDLVCSESYSILITFERLNPAERDWRGMVTAPSRSEMPVLSSN